MSFIITIYFFFPKFCFMFHGILKRFTSVYPGKFRDMILQHGYILEKETVLYCVNQSYYFCFLCCSKRLTRWSRQASKVRSIIHSVWFILSDLSCLRDFFLLTGLQSAHSKRKRSFHENIGARQTTFSRLKKNTFFCTLIS